MTAKMPVHALPKLRFPEFANEPPWECPALGKLAKRVTKRNSDGAEPRALTNSAEHGVVDQKDFFDKVIPVKTDNYFVVDEGDYVYNPRVSAKAPVGPISKNQIGRGVMSPLYTVFRFRNETNDYFAHYFKSSNWYEYIRRVSNSGARHDRLAISNDDFMQMPIPTPAPREQQKIVDCLNSLNYLIAAESQKLDALWRHKQGLLQQLFPPPGETIPHLGSQTSWQTKDLAKVAFFQEGPGIMAVDFCDHGVPLVRLSGVSGKTVTLDGCNYLDPEKVAQKWDHFRLVSGDLLISTSASLGRVSVVSEEAAGAVFYTGLVRFPSKSEYLSDEFLKVYLESPHFIRQVEGHAVGGGIKHFGPTHLRQMQIQFPGPVEQDGIADCISLLDGGIEAQTRKVGTLGQHKKGLLQKLFPSLKGPGK